MAKVFFFNVAFKFSPIYLLKFCRLKKKSCVFLTIKHSCLFSNESSLSNYILVDSHFLQLFTVLIWDAIMLQLLYQFQFFSFHNLLLLLFTSFFIFFYLIPKRYLLSPLLDVASLELIVLLWIHFVAEIYFFENSWNRIHHRPQDWDKNWGRQVRKEHPEQ